MDELLGVVRHRKSVRRRRKVRYPGCRIDEIRGDDDDQFALVALKLLGTEKLAQDRDVPEPWHLRDVLGVGVLQQTAEHKTLAAAQLDGCFRSPSRQGGDRKTLR